MADPKLKFKRSSVPGKIPNETQVPLGEIAINTHDGKVFASKNVGVGTTVFVVNPWSVGTGTDSYDTYFTNGNVGIGTTDPTTKLTVQGDVRITGGIYDSNNNIGSNGSVLTSTGAGVSWISGSSGVQGLQGIQGIQGIQGLDGQSYNQGIQGIQGITGDQGSQGTQGTIGPQGVQGINGDQGSQGIQGIIGSQGIQGIIGSQGIQGIQGIIGSQGIQGITGDQGSQGIQGIQGLDGQSYNQGIQGIQGIKGEDGIIGVNGSQGVQGIQGITGDQGSQGTTGTQGIQGIAGDQGSQGTTGTQGIQGIAGDQGSQGIQGITGPVAGSANQVVYKDGSNNPTGSANLTFDGTSLNATEFVGGGSDLRNLSGVHLVSYASASDISNSANSISGVSTYTQVGILTGSLAVSMNDRFGVSVATNADGKTIVVGAHQDETGSATNTGVAYVFDRVGNNFNQVGILTGSLAADIGEFFGYSVSTSADGKTIIVGAYNDEIGATTGTGVVYVFDRIGN
jgi:hypothetical protein